MTELEKQELQLKFNTSELRKELKKEEPSKSYVRCIKSNEPLTDEEFRRVFRNEFLTIDDPRYFRQEITKSRRK